LLEVVLPVLMGMQQTEPQSEMAMQAQVCWMQTVQRKPEDWHWQ
jgi:hypothetical protein